MVCGQTCSTGKKGNLSGTSGARLRMGGGGGGLSKYYMGSIQREFQLLLQGVRKGWSSRNLGGAAQEGGGSSSRLGAQLRG